MKCTHCGKNEVNFFYRQNINGKVSEENLCSECAQRLGYARDIFAESRKMMSSMLDGFFGRSFPGLMGARDFLSLGEKSCEEGCACEKKQAEKTEVDPVLAKRREINALRHQMKMAVSAEDFEKAAEIRDKIRGLEG